MMAAEGFKVGNVVQLKSGGPKMTGVEVDLVDYGIAGRTVTCAWFAGSKKELGSFPPDALLLAPEEKPKK